MRRSELPTVPPPFNVDRFAKDSDAKLVAPTDGQPDERAVGRSETRLATRPAMAAVVSDDAWARQMTGAVRVAIPLELLKGMPLDHRAGYLLSWMDGSVDLDTLVEVSTMPRAEVIRIVRDLYESGVVQFG
jgi:hypothetical protein